MWHVTLNKFSIDAATSFGGGPDEGLVWKGEERHLSMVNQLRSRLLTIDLCATLRVYRIPTVSSHLFDSDSAGSNLLL
jgi:hypothetical protein